MGSVMGMVALTALAVGGADGRGPATVEADTTVAVTPDTRLEVRIPHGEVRVTTGAEGRVRVDGSPDVGWLLELRRRGNTLYLALPEEMDEQDPEPGRQVVRIEVPPELETRIESEDADVYVDGLSGFVTVEAGDGDVVVRGPAGRVDARSVDGDVDVTGATGSVDAYSPDGEVRVSGVSGDVRAESIDGEVILTDLTSRNVQASSTDGEVELSGELMPGASYRLSSHDGDVLLRVAGEPDASFQVTVYEGTFTSSRSLPGVERTREGRGTRYRFLLGSGSSRVQLETFDGDIHLSFPAHDQ